MHAVIHVLVFRNQCIRVFRNPRIRKYRAAGIYNAFTLDTAVWRLESNESWNILTPWDTIRKTYTCVVQGRTTQQRCVSVPSILKYVYPASRRPKRIINPMFSLTIFSSTARACSHCQILQKPYVELSRTPRIARLVESTATTILGAFWFQKKTKIYIIRKFASHVYSTRRNTLKTAAQWFRNESQAFETLRLYARGAMIEATK